MEIQNLVMNHESQLGSIFIKIIDKNAGCTYESIKSIVHGQTGLHKCLWIYHMDFNYCQHTVVKNMETINFA